mgnify:FL=1
MKEALLKLLNNDILYQMLSLILTPVLGYLLVMYSKAKKKLIATLEQKTKESPNKIDDVVVRIISDFVKEGSGLDSGNVAIKGIIENISTELKNNAKKNVEEVVKVELQEKLENEFEEKLGEKINLVTDVLSTNIEKKIHAADALGNTLYTDNFKVTEIINSEKELLKKDVNGYVTAYAEAQAKITDSEKFAQGIVGIAATKTF